MDEQGCIVLPVYLLSDREVERSGRDASGLFVFDCGGRRCCVLLNEVRVAAEHVVGARLAQEHGLTFEDV